MASACVYLNDPATGYEYQRAGRHGWAPTNSANLYGGGDVGVCVCACVCVYGCVCVCSRLRVRACMRMHACVMCL